MCRDYLVYSSDNLLIELREIGQWCGTNYHYYIFSKGGFTQGLLQAQERGEVRLVSLADLYK